MDREEFLKKLPEGHPPYMENRVCIDKANGHDVEMPAELYYRYGNINPEEVTRYTLEELRLNMLMSRTYGPWDKRIFEAEGTKPLKVRA